MTSTPPRIAIVGAGPAGLTTSLLLHERGIPSTIFELRQTPTNEELAKPSGSLDLHEESGIAAIKECGLFNEFLKLTGECSEAQKVSDKHGNILHIDEGGLSNRPEVSRHTLSQLLISCIPAHQIKWGHKLLSATRTRSTASGHPEIDLDFGPHGKQAFDLVIGADGAWSKVRSLLTDVKPHYAGTQCITLTIREVTNKYPHLAELVGQGTFSALGDRHGVMTQRGPQDSVRIYLMLTTENEFFAKTVGLAGQTAAAVKSWLLGDAGFFNTWGPAIKELVAVGCDEEVTDNPGAAADIRPLYMLPVGQTWEHKAGATIIGDAAHLMCPWAGEGVNLAMWDSLLLSHAIIKAHEIAGMDDSAFHSTLDSLVREFEVDMMARSKEKAEETLSNGRMLFGEDGAKAFAEFFQAVYQPTTQADDMIPGHS